MGSSLPSNLGGDPGSDLGVRGTGFPAEIMMSTRILDDQGAFVMAVGQVIEANTDLKQKVETLQSAVASQGGATLGRFTVASKAALRLLGVKEMTGGKGCPVAVFTDPVSITSHNIGNRIVGSDPELASELKALERAGMSKPMD